MKYTNYILAAGLLGSANLYAAPFTDTGSIYRQIKNNADRHIEKKAHPKYKTKEEHHALIHDVNKILVKGFKVVGNEDLSKQELKTVMKPFVDRELSMSEIHGAAHTLAEYYHKKGYFAAEVKLRPHSIHNGIVTLNVEEGHLEKGGISITNSGERIKSEKVLKLWNSTLKPGVLKQEDYERAMLLTNDLPGISAKADMYLGEKAGIDDLVVTITDEDVFNGNVDIDNFGSYYTGRTQIGTTLYWNSPTKNGEEIVARFITTGKYSSYGYIDVSIPVFNNDTRIGASFDFIDYELDHQKVNESGDGTAWNAHVYMKHPFIRTQDLTVEGEIAYVHTSLKDNDSTGEIDDSEIDKGVLKISGNRSDDYLLNGITYFDVALTTGHLKLNNQDHKANDALTSSTAGNFTKLNFEFSRLQNLVSDLSTNISLKGQWASKNLDTSEKFFLGGPYGVSGYPVGTVAGDNAALFYADLRYDFYDMPWGGDFQLKTFYSYGWTEIFKNPESWQALYPGDQYDDDNEVKLQTVGVGISQTWSDTAVIRVMVGKQVGDNVLRKYYEDGEDYDHSDSDYRAWVEAIYYF